jgi:hypothetical protein
MTRVHQGGAPICALIAIGQRCNCCVGKLYPLAGPCYYGCWRCYELTYTSCLESRKYDRLFRHLAAEREQDFASVKQMMNRIGRRTL